MTKWINDHNATSDDDKRTRDLNGMGPLEEMDDHDMELLTEGADYHNDRRDG